MSKKISRIICWILLFLMINQGYDVKAAYAYTIDFSEQIIDTAKLSLEGKDLNSLINSLISDGKKNIYIKNGTYHLSDSIIIDQPDVSIYGESNTNTKFVQDNSGAKSIVITQSNIHVSNLYIDGSFGREVFHAQNAQNVSVEDCVIDKSTSYPAIAFYGDSTNKSINNSINGNEIHTNVLGTVTEKDAIIFYNQKNGAIIDNVVLGGRISLNLCKDSKVSNNTIKDSVIAAGIRVTVPGQNNEISNNIIENTKESGIAVVKENSGDANSLRFDEIKITNNTIKNSKYFGIEVCNLENAIISDNIIGEIGYEGIYLLYSDNSTIKNNSVSNCGQSNDNATWQVGLSSGIFLDVGVKNSDIVNNIIHNDNTCPYGIRIQNGAGNSNNTLLNNIIEGDFTNKISANLSSPEYTNVFELINVTPYSIELKWAKVLSTTEYELQVQDEQGNIIGENPRDVGTSESYICTGLNSNTTYKFRLRIKGDPLWSNPVVATTSVQLPPTLMVQSVTKNTIEVKWDEVVGATGYELKVDSIIEDVGSNKNYIHTGLADNTSHIYKVRVKGGQWSNEVTATTLAKIGEELPQITTPAAVKTPDKIGEELPQITTPAAVKTSNNSSHSNNNNNTEKDYYKLELAFGNQRTLIYQEKLIKDIEEDKLRRMILYTFEKQYYLGIKMWKNNQIVFNTQFEINLISDNLFTDSEIRNISIDRNDNIDTILVKDVENGKNLINNQEKIGLSKYSIADGYILSIDNTRIDLQDVQKYTISINEGN